MAKILWMAKMWSIAKDMLLDTTLPEATTDCCVANTIVNGRFRKKTMIMWLKGMWIKDIS